MQIRQVVLAQPDSNKSSKLLAALNSRVGLKAAGKQRTMQQKLGRQACLLQGDLGFMLLPLPYISPIP